MHARTKWKAREKESCITARVEAGLMKEAVTFSEENTDLARHRVLLSVIAPFSLEIYV